MTEEEIDKLKKQNEKLQSIIGRVEELHHLGEITIEDYMYIISGTIG